MNATVKEYANDNKTLATYIIREMFKQGTPVTVNQELTLDQIAFLNTKKPWPSRAQGAPIKQGIYSSRTADKFVVRLSDGLRERINKISTSRHRSMNSQIIHWLEMCVELEEQCENGFSKEELLALFESEADRDAVIIPMQRVNYTPAPGCPVRLKNDGGVWLVRNYVARDGDVKAILECFTESNQPALLDVAIDQLEPV